MSKKTNPTVIGAFVVGGAILLAVAAAIFGGSELLAKRNIFVAYFVENTQGLKPGSNVVVNGVRVGHVSEVTLLVDNESFEYMTAVMVEVLTESFVVTSNGQSHVDQADTPEYMAALIDEAGLRATLDVESFVTGQLLVELVIRPETESIRRGERRVPYPEIPTIPSRSQELISKVQTAVAQFGEAFDIDEIGEHVENILEGVDELANSEDLRETLAGLNSIVNQDDTQELTTTLRATLDNLSTAAADASSLLQNADGAVDTLGPAAAKIDGVLEEAQATLAAARVTLQGDSTEAYQLATTLHEVEAAARALREFLDYLERNPEALLRGKQ